MVELKKSDVMSEKSGIENKIIRMPKKLREELNVVLGEFIVIKQTALQVDRVFKQDKSNNKLTAFVTQKILDKIGVLENTLVVTKNITIGCDPELFLVDRTSNQLYNPSFLFNKESSVGYDGMLAELRPSPSVDSKVVTKNIYNLIVKLQNTLIENNLNNIRIVAGSAGWNYFAGFHVHMGIPSNLLNSDYVGRIKAIKIIIKALDYYVSTLAVLAEGEDFLRRCSPFISYGKVSDYRVDTKTLEYRVPGGSLLRHPVLTHGLLSLCSLVSHDVIERLRVFTLDFSNDILENEETLLTELYPNILCTKDMFDVICSPSLTRTKEEAIKVIQDLKCMANYTCYKEPIEEFNKLSQTHVSNCVWSNWSKY